MRLEGKNTKQQDRKDSGTDDGKMDAICEKGGF
jgi:hypothetical protein